MSTRREILTGLSAAVVSILILAGSLLVANTEMRATIAQEFAPTATMTPVPTQIIVATPLPGQPTYTPSPSPSDTPTAALAVCPPPAGWVPITVQAGDSLESLAEVYNTTESALKQGNCLEGNTIYPGTWLYVPNSLPPTSIPCGPPPGWVYHIVRPGDNLFQLSQIYGVSVSALQAANCMGSSTTIRVGQRLYVPNVPPNFSPTPPATNTPLPATATLTVIPPSATATKALPSSTVAPASPTPTNTPVTISATPTWTATVTNTPLPPTPTHTFTPEPPTATPTEWPSPTTPPTSTPRPPTNTPLPPTATP